MDATVAAAAAAESHEGSFRAIFNVAALDAADGTIPFLFFSAHVPAVMRLRSRPVTKRCRGQMFD